MKYILNCCTTIFRFINLDLGEIQWRSSRHMYIIWCSHKHYVFHLSAILLILILPCGKQRHVYPAWSIPTSCTWKFLSYLWAFVSRICWLLEDLPHIGAVMMLTQQLSADNLICLIPMWHHSNGIDALVILLIIVSDNQDMLPAYLLHQRWLPWLRASLCYLQYINNGLTTELWPLNYGH